MKKPSQHVRGNRTRPFDPLRPSSVSRHGTGTRRRAGRRRKKTKRNNNRNNNVITTCRRRRHRWERTPRGAPLAAYARTRPRTAAERVVAAPAGRDYGDRDTARDSTARQIDGDRQTIACAYGSLSCVRVCVCAAVCVLACRKRVRRVCVCVKHSVCRVRRPVVAR